MTIVMLKNNSYNEGAENRECSSALFFGDNSRERMRFYNLMEARMEHSVDDVIGELSEIEAEAVRIMNVTDAGKRVMADRMNTRTKEFDQVLAEQTREELRQMKEDFELQKDQELSGLQAETENMLRKMQEKFDQKYETWIDEIVQSIVRV